MSTKTTFKRIALVTVAALALGGFSAVSSNAAQTVAQTYLNCTKADGGTITPSATKGAACNGVAGVANFVQLTSLSSAKDVLITTTAGVLSAASGATVATGGASATVAAGQTPVFNLTTPAVGTITVSVYTATAGSGIYSATAAETVSITVNASAKSGIFDAANSTVFLASGETDTAVDADATVVATSAAATGTAKATVQVALVDLLGAAYDDTITAVVTGGNIYGQTGSTSASTTAVSIGQDVTPGTVSSVVYTKGGLAWFTLFSNGQVGTATVSLTLSDGTKLPSKTITFSGSTAKLVATPLVKYIANSGTSTADVFSVVATDSSGNAVTGQAPTMTIATADSARATAGSCTEQTTKGTYYCAVTAASAATEGALTVTFKGGDVATVTTTASTFITTKLAATLTITAADSVVAGDKVTYTLTAKNAAGNPVADGTYTFFASVSANASFSGSDTRWTTTVAVVDGSATSYVYAPANSFKSTWTLAGTAATATTNLVAALAATTVDVSTAVTNATLDAAAAALDAAQEATDAANAAYDAANNAMDSADAATAAAQDAADNAAQALTAVTALSATVAKLVKQISAIAATLAKIQKKIGA
jgi:hypothetical protein